MAQSDGWVGERMSSDHTVLPDLSDWSQPVSAIATVETYLDEPYPDGPNLDGASFHGLTLPGEPIQGGIAPRATEQAPATGGRSVAPVLVGLMTVVAIGVGGFFAWPLISEFWAQDEIPETVALTGDPTQRFVISDGTIYLEGSVPDQEVSRFIEEAAQNALGGERVINNFEISDDAVFDPNEPVLLSVAETVRFSTGQAQVNEEYAPLIDLAVELMSSRPSTVLRIVGHTDDQGPEEDNLLLSIERANAVAEEIERRGVVVSRLTVDGRGESEPIESNDTPEGRSANRRVEFFISGLLDG